MSTWNESTIGEISNYINRGFSPKYVENDGEIIINQKCIRDGRIDFTLARLTDSAKTITAEKILHFGDIVINSTGVGTAGRVGIFTSKFKATADSHVSIIRINKNRAEPFFIFYNLRQRESDIEGFAEGSTGQIELGRERIKTIDILLPPLPEQRAIAAVLFSFDDKIDLLHRQNKTLEAMAETLFRQWFVEEADKDCKEDSLLELIEIIGGGTPKTSIPDYWDGNVPWLSGGDIASNHKSFVLNTEKYITETGLINSSSKLLPKYATVISARGTVGKYCLLARPMAFSQSNYGILPKIDNCYFFSYLLINHVVEELQSSAYGSVFDTITTATFKEIKLQIPSEPEIRSFEISISSYFNKILQNMEQIRTLEKLRDTLLPKLMSGEVRVAV